MIKSEKTDILLRPGERVCVYKNLNKNLLSVKSVRTGIVVCYAEHGVVLKDVKFHVSQTGRKRVIAKKCREVHAWLLGTLVELEPKQLVYNQQYFDQPYDVIYYNPFKTPTFVNEKTWETITHAELAVVIQNRVHVPKAEMTIDEQLLWSL